MENQYINCPNCGTRNFLDDNLCGVCKTRLNTSLTQGVEKTDNSKTSVTSYFMIAFVVGVIALIWYGNTHFKYKDSSIGVITNTNTPVNTSGNNENSSNSTLTYSLLEVSKNNKYSFCACVRINEKLSNEILATIAQRVKNNINTVSDKGTVFFLLPEMKLDDGAWAAVDFDPFINVRMIGRTIADENIIKSNLNNIKDYYGVWQDNSIGAMGDVLVRIRKDKEEGFVFELISATDPKPSKLANPLNKTTKNGKVVFVEKEGDQFFVVEKNGNLSVYDNDGFVVTYIRVK